MKVTVDDKGKTRKFLTLDECKVGWVYLNTLGGKNAYGIISMGGNGVKAMVYLKTGDSHTSNGERKFVEVKAEVIVTGEA